MKPSLKFPILLALLMSAVVAVPAAYAGASGGVQDVRDIDVRSSVASPSEIAAAKPIKPYLRGSSVNEPDACLDQSGNPLTRLTADTDFGKAAGNGLSISPGGFDITNLLPGADYRLCFVLRNYSKGPAQVAVDDVDLRASETADASVQLIDQTNGVGTWIIPSTRAFVAQPGMRYYVPYILRVPPNLPAGTIVGGVRVVRQAIDEPVQAGVTQRLYVSSPGGRRGKLDISNLSSSRVITGKPGKAALRVKYTVRNGSDYLNSIGGNLEVRAFGRKVAQSKVPPTTLLPDGSEKIALRQEDLPWIGVFRPTLKLQTSNGDIERKLPLVWVLPPTLYVVLLLIALLAPLLYFAWRWRQRRQEWRAYLEDDEIAPDDDAYHDDGTR